MKRIGQRWPLYVTILPYISSLSLLVLHSIPHPVESPANSSFIKPGATDSNMLVVSDIEDVFLPKPSDLLVNLAEARTSLEGLLGRVHDMFQENSIIGNALGPALQAAFKLLVRCLLLLSFCGFANGCMLVIVPDWR